MLGCVPRRYGWKGGDVDLDTYFAMARGRQANGTPVTGNDPLDTSQQINAAFVGDWVEHLVGRYGAASGDGVRYYALDNEPMLWHETHRDIHPNPATYDEVRDAALEFAPAIKAADPNAQILGPAEWGWWAYFCSARDIVVHCRTGVRSAQAVEFLQDAGFEHVWNLKGGIHAWTDEVDSSLPKY